MYNLKIKSLVKHYNQPLLEGVDISHTGQGVIALIGDNGSGKSTLLKILAGLEEPDSGEVIWDKKPTIGFLTQEIEGGEALSGGQKKLLRLADLLYSGLYDVVILDEPDNHLDLENKIWLEEALAAFGGLVILISHDRAFLENVSTKIWLLENHQVRTFPFGYAKFKAVYEEEEEANAKLYKTQLKEKKRLEEMAEMFHRKSLIGAYRNTQKRLARHLAAMVDDPAKKKGAITISVKEEDRQIKKKTAVLIKDLVFGYTGELLFDHANLHLFVGDKVALLSPNGTGKSTLVNLLLEKLKPVSGEAKVGSNLRVGYYSQEHNETLPLEETPLSVFAKRHPLSDHEIEAVLKKFFFNKQTIRSKIWTLSGGQKSRLQLALFLYENPNLLILDEPTNHLDLKSVMALEKFLQGFSGTLLLVSHDRELVKNTCDKIYAIQNKKISET